MTDYKRIVESLLPRSVERRKLFTNKKNVTVMGMVYVQVRTHISNKK